MKLSLKVEYACRVLGQLGRTFGSTDLAHIEDLAKAESIPANYLVQILNELRNSGLIISRRGKQGGYALARDPETISLYDIIRVVDGELLELNLSPNGHSGSAVSKVWEDVATAMEARARSYSVADFVTPDDDVMYYI